MARGADIPSGVIILFDAAVDMDIITDQALPILRPCNSYLPIAWFLLGTNGSCATAVGGIYTGTGKPAGGILIPASQTYATITAAGEGKPLTPTALGYGLRTSQTLYLSLTTPEGVARTGRVLILGAPHS